MTTEKKYILALDQGTTSSRAILFDKNSRVIGVAQQEIRQIFPEPGWVEHDPMNIWEAQRDVMLQVVKEARIDPLEIASIGITNQRETTVLWDRKTGLPVYNAIVWQCRRTASYCDELKEIENFPEYVREHTGLVLDAYFSGTKLKWLLNNVDGARIQADSGDLLFGTIDTWLLWKLTGGKVHATDVSNASRTMLFNIKTLEWDKRILYELDIPLSLLPQVKDSSTLFGFSSKVLFGGVEIPISGIAGDQQAALFGQCCFEPGMAKNTYGTGCFLMMNTGSQLVFSNKGLLSTIAWGIDGNVVYALEGSVFMAGAAIQWLRDELNLIKTAAESEECANQVADSGGVYVVPAFAGLGAPYWDMYARGTITGLTRGTNKNHIVRATLEAIAYRVRDVFGAVKEACDTLCLQELKVDGGASLNNFLMQFQADMLHVSVIRPAVVETTALGVAYLAGLSVKFWNDMDEIKSNWHQEREFIPHLSKEDSWILYKGWKKAVARASNWIEPEAN